MKKYLGKISPPILLSFFLGALLFGSRFVFSFTEPTLTPPLNNTPPPLHTGSEGQSKSGGLILNTGGATYGLIVDKGSVGIGTANPSQKLDVAGYIRAATGLCIGSDCRTSWPTTSSIPWSSVTGKPAGFADDVDNDSQTLSISGSTLSISGGNSIVLPSPLTAEVRGSDGIMDTAGGADIVSANITTTGGTVMVQGRIIIWQKYIDESCGTMPSHGVGPNNWRDSIKLIRDSTELDSQVFFSRGSFGNDFNSPQLGTFVALDLDSPSAGSHTYKLRINSEGEGFGACGGIPYRLSGLWVTELK